MGAHRAGTTGVICVMHYRGNTKMVNILQFKTLKIVLGLSESAAISYASEKRSLINPIGDFPLLLRMCDKLPRDNNNKFII